jgi:cyclic pyranopterin phosphate synthase
MKDVFGRTLADLRVSVTDRCNFRCVYCMPEEIYGERYQFLPKPELLTYEEIERLVRLFVSLGARKVRITGGEPLLRSHLDILIAKLGGIDGLEDLTLTTNGYLLQKQALSLKKAGLQRVTVSLDALDDTVLENINGRKIGSRRILDGIKTANEVGLHPIKVNMVVQRGINDHAILDMIKYFKGTGNIVRFIEYMDVGTRNQWELNQVVDAAAIVRIINKQFPIEPIAKSYLGEVANRYRFLDGKGEIGIISSVTNPFCAQCTRARLSADGKLFTCLFSGNGLDLKTPLRQGADDEALLRLMHDTWSKRSDRYSELRSRLSETERSQPKIEMYQIGG